MKTIADIIRSGLAAGKSTEDILADVKAQHPAASTNAACVAYYRSKAKKSASDVIARAKTERPRPAAAPVAPSYTAKITRTFQGMEGGGFNASLFRDGKKVCTVIDDASGGCYMYEWVDAKGGATAKSKVYGYDDVVREIDVTPEEKLFRDTVFLCEKSPYSFERDGKVVEGKMTDDCYVYDLILEADALRTVQRLTKNAVAFVTLDGRIMSMKVGSHSVEAVVAHAKKKYEGCVVLNELSQSEAVARVRVLQGE